MKLRYYQERAVGALLDSFYSTDDRPLVVLPTGTGKSLVVASLVKHLLEWNTQAKIVIATHSQDIVQQNHDELLELWKFAPAGIYSAGLGKRNPFKQITFVGIQSVYNKVDVLGKVDYLLIDEAHTLPKSGDGMWLTFLSALYNKNPGMKLGGLTATPYRLDTGCLFRGEGAIFTNICYEYSVLQAIEDGYLCELVNAPVEATINTQGVRHNKNNEFILKDLEKVARTDKLTNSIVRETLQYAQATNRRKWLAFATSVEHAEELCSAFVAQGVAAACLTSKTSKTDRVRLIRDFRRGSLTCLVTVEMTTTGFNVKDVDLLIITRPTESEGLWVQILGRGTRVLYAANYPLDTPEQRRAAIAKSLKPNCGVLDFTKNTENHGPIDRIKPKERLLSSGNGEAPIKTCPNCLTFCYAGVKKCHSCDYEFPPSEIQLSAQPSRAALLSTQGLATWFAVTDVFYEKRGDTQIHIEYVCGNRKVTELIDLSKSSGKKWCNQNSLVATNAKEFLAAKKKNPAKVCGIKKGKYWNVIARSFTI